MDDAFKRVFIFDTAEIRTSLHAECGCTIITEAVPDVHVKLRLTRRCSLAVVHFAQTYTILPHMIPPQWFRRSITMKDYIPCDMFLDESGFTVKALRLSAENGCDWCKLILACVDWAILRSVRCEETYVQVWQVDQYEYGLFAFVTANEILGSFELMTISKQSQKSFL
jgi:hypothetical protein